MTPLRALTVVVGTSAVLLGAAACRSGAADPPVTAFSAGACRAAAPAVLSVGHTVRDALTHDRSAVDTMNRLTADQERLRAVQRGLGAGQRAELQPLVTAIGLYRLHAVGHTASREVMADVATAQRGIVRQCTSDGGPS